MKGRRMFGAFSAVFSIIIILCASSCKIEPEDVVKKYLEHTFLDNNSKKAYRLLSSEDKHYVSEVEFERSLKKKNMLNRNILQKYNDFFDYEIVDTHTNNDTTYVKVLLSKPNAMNVLHEIISYAMLTTFSELTDEEKNEAIANKFEHIMMSKDRLTVSEERIFKVIKEDDSYRLYLNLGAPVKEEKLRATLEYMHAMAKEEERRTNIEEAINIYKQMLKISAKPEFEEKLHILEQVRNNTTRLEEIKTAGNLKFSPKKIEKRKVLIYVNEQGSTKYKLSEKEYLVLRAQVKNVSEGEVFSTQSRYKSTYITDNFGNKLHKLRLKSSEIAFEGEHKERLRPGEETYINIVCEAPLTDVPDNYMWNIPVQTDNKGTESTLFVSFSKNEIQQVEVKEPSEPLVVLDVHE